jgi:hypothetical protein
MVLPRLC